MALWQVQVDHPVRARSLTYQMRDGFNDFLRAESAKNPAVPKTVQDLAYKAGIRLVVTDAKDPEEIGFIQWRVAFYIAADDLKNFLYLLDGWFVFKGRQMAREQPFEVHLYQHLTVDIAGMWDELEYGHYTLQEPAKELPLGIFEAQPVNRKVITMNIQVRMQTNLIRSGLRDGLGGRFERTV